MKNYKKKKKQKKKTRQLIRHKHLFGYPHCETTKLMNLFGYLPKKNIIRGRP